MIKNLLFSLERISPFFLLIVIGYLLVWKGGIPSRFFSAANNFVFKVALPINVFCSIASPDSPALDFGFMGYVFLLSLGSFFALWGVTEVFYRREKAIIGTLVQGAYRSNMALVGVPIVTAVAGDHAAQLAVAGVTAVIPVYNILSVVVLTVRGKSREKIDWRMILKDVAENRLIIALVLAIPFMLWDIRIPQFAFRTLGYVGQIAVPLGLISIGGLFNLKDASARLGPAVYTAILKIVVLPVLAAAVSYLAGYQGIELLVVFLLFATPTAFSSYAFASSMGGDAPLASNILILTTLFSSFSFAAGIYLMKAMGVF